MSESEDTRKYHVNNDDMVQGQVIGDYNKVELHFHHPQDKAPSPSKPQRVWNIPYLHNDYFTGREEILEQLHARFKANHATALSQRHAMSGLGGIGKTQIAVQYAYQHCDEYQSVLWARAESHEALTSSFVEIARLLDLPQKDEQDQTMIVQAVKRWLQGNTGWLLILDNADEPKIVREFLPTKFDGHMLLTTRAQALGGLAQRIEVDTFTPELGALFLLRRATLIGADGAIDDALQSDREVAVQISKELGGLPLALDQAGAYIEETSCSLADYLDLYRTRRVEVLKERGGLTDDHPDSVATTWSLSFQRVEEKNAAAADLLRFCAFLAPDAIPEEIITAGAEHLGPLLQTAVRDPLALNKAIAALGAYSLIRRDPSEKTLSIHRLVQAVLRDAITEDEAKMWAERTVCTVNAVFPTVDGVKRQLAQRYILHAQACTKLINQWSMKHAEAARLLHETGSYFLMVAQYMQAEPLLKHGLEIREHALQHYVEVLSHHSESTNGMHVGSIFPATAGGSEHFSVISSLSNLALLYQVQGKHEQAKPLLIHVLEMVEQIDGPDGPNVSTALNNLAETNKAELNYKQAESLLLRALQIDVRRFGQKHREVATDLNNLAELYRIQGMYELAESLQAEALAIREDLLGSKDPHTISSYNNLALIFHKQGKYQQAELLYQRIQATFEEAYGSEHPDLATSIVNLALLYQDWGKNEEAKQLHQRALAIYEKTLGPEHPYIRQTRQNYAALLRAMGSNEEAKQLEEKQ